MESGSRQRRALTAAIAAFCGMACASLVQRAISFSVAEGHDVTEIRWFPLVKGLGSLVVIAAIGSVAVLMRSLPSGQGTSLRDWRRASPTALLLLLGLLIISNVLGLIQLADGERALMTGAAGCSLWAFQAWRDGAEETTGSTLSPPQ
jgi:hypothetical protein